MAGIETAHVQHVLQGHQGQQGQQEQQEHQRRAWGRRRLGVLLAGGVAAACGYRAADRSGPSGAPAADPRGPRTIKNDGGQVTVEVTWAGPRTGAAGTTSEVVFEVVLDTHAVDLDGYDLRQLAVLRTDSGTEVRPAEWTAPKGGHHRKGALVFPSAAGGNALLGPDVRSLELVVRDIAGVPERTFTWAL